MLYKNNTMNTFKSSAELKAIAKEKLLGQYSTTIGAILLIFCISFMLNGIVVTVAYPSSILTFVIYQIALFIIELLMGIFVAGRTYMYMNIIYSQPSSVSDIFYVLTSHPDKALGIQLVFSGISLIANIPSFIFIEFFYGTSAQYSTAASLCILISCIGLLVYIYVALTLSQSFYILLDFPDRSLMDILKTSVRLMKGNKFRLFYIYISFIPLMLLCVITLFVPLLWLRSYMDATMAAFYQDLIAVTSANMASENH